MDQFDTNRPAANAFLFHVIRYTPSLVRDEWVNIGILLFDADSGELRLRLIEGPAEFARIRRLQPGVDEQAIRHLRDHLQDRFSAFLQSERQEKGDSAGPGEVLQHLIDLWNATLSNGIQLRSAKAVYADDIDLEMDRLYGEQVAPAQKEKRPGASESHPSLRNYCSQVWKQAGLWGKIAKSVRVEPYTFPGDPMRIDYSYQRNGTRGFVHCLSVSHSPRDCKEYAYTARLIAQKVPSEFAAVTDVELRHEVARHRFVLDTLNDGGIIPISRDAFATWVPKFKAQIR
jgi:hypothetical protein